jgi:hypothetical protein
MIPITKKHFFVYIYDTCILGVEQKFWKIK